MSMNFKAHKYRDLILGCPGQRKNELMLLKERLERGDKRVTRKELKDTLKMKTDGLPFPKLTVDVKREGKKNTLL